jgi:hypothetical protein
VVLKVWDANATAGSANFTTVTYTAATAATANAFCLSCHDADTTKITFTGNATEPANIAGRWNTLASNTTNYSKYDGSTYNTVPQITKAYNPHRFPITNIAKTAPGGEQMTSLPAPWSRSIANDNAVACLDCHPAHGSSLASGTNAVMGTGGKMLFDNNGTITTEEGLCWACHTKGMDYYGDGTGANDRWKGNWLGRVLYKQGGFRSSHFYSSKSASWNLSGTTPSGFSGSPSETGTPSGTRTTVYCSTCHNPHGVATGDSNAAYRVPILRGTWLSAPYKEDRAPGSVQNWSVSTYTSTKFPVSSSASDYLCFSNKISKDGGCLPRVTPNKDQSEVHPGRGYDDLASQPTSAWDGYFIDANTFHGKSTPYIDETDTQFAGLCMTADCHDQTVLTSAWGGHKTVKGWGPSTTDLFRGTKSTRPPAGAGGPWQPSDNTLGSEWGMQFFGGVDTGAAGGDYNANQTSGATAMWGSRNNQNTTLARKPIVNTFLGYTQYYWGTNAATTGKIDYATQSTGGVNGTYHRFPCSKCHSPHASRLERLMVTNCLDNGDGFGDTTGIHMDSNSDSAAYLFMVTNQNMFNPEAVNCHSVAGSASGGWNTITPW